jgi:hypothetical protein
MPMPLKHGQRYDPKKVLDSKTIKTIVGDGLDTAGVVELDVMSGGLPVGPTVRLGLLVKANQTVRKFRFRSTNHDVLSGYDAAIEADLNATLLRPWEKGTRKWVGFSLPLQKIPSKISNGKIDLDVEFSLKPFTANGAQEMVIVFQPGDETSFGNGHFNYGVSVLKPSAAARASAAKGAPKAGTRAGATARSTGRSKSGRGGRRSR